MLNENHPWKSPDMIWCGVYAQLVAIAKPIIEAYHADLTKHDAETLRNAEPSDRFLWQCRPCGTWLIRVNYRDGETRDSLTPTSAALEWFRAIEKQEQGNQWYLLTMRDQTVAPVSVETADNMLSKPEFRAYREQLA